MDGATLVDDRVHQSMLTFASRSTRRIGRGVNALLRARERRTRWNAERRTGSEPWCSLSSRYPRVDRTREGPKTLVPPGARPPEPAARGRRVQALAARRAHRAAASRARAAPWARAAVRPRPAAVPARAVRRWEVVARQPAALHRVA